MKKKGILILVVAVSILLASIMIQHTKVRVSTDDPSNMQESAGMPFVYPDYYEYTANETVDFQAVVKVSDKFQENRFYETLASFQEYDTQAALEWYKKITDSYEVNAYDMADHSGKKTKGYSYWDNDDNILILYPDMYSYTKQKEWRHYNCAFGDTKIAQDMYNADAYSKEDNLSFAAREKALSQILDHLENIGYTVGENRMVCYALDAETMNRKSSESEARILAAEGGTEGYYIRTDWNEEQEAYAFYLWQECQGLPVYTETVTSLSYLEEASAPVQALVRKDGILMIRATDILDMEEGKTYVSLLPFEEIIRVISEKYDGIITDDKITVTEMELAALVNRDGRGGGSILPVWLCSYRNQDGNPAQMVIHAATGYEIYGN